MRRCRRCELHISDQVLSWGGFEYSVAAALKVLLRNPRDPETIPGGDAYELMLRHVIHKGHVTHVDTSFPAIAVTTRQGPKIIDGAHRVWRCLMERKAVRAYILTPGERDGIRTAVDY